MKNKLQLMNSGHKLRWLLMIVIQSAFLLFAQYAAASKIYFKNTSDWSTVKAYRWSGNCSGDSWPGTAMTSEGGSYYSIDYCGGSVIFNNGSSTQTGDLTQQEGKCYNFSTSSWEDYTPVTYTYYLVGFSDWSNPIAMTVTDGVASCTKALDANTTYTGGYEVATGFKIKRVGSDDSETWYGNNGSMTVDNCTGWTMATGKNNCGITTTDAYNYTFSFDISTNKLSVTYPPVTITFVDVNNWDKVYYFIPETSSTASEKACNWTSNGFSPNNGGGLKAYGEITTKSGNTYTLEIPANLLNGSCITFAKSDQHTYGDFYGNEAVHCSDFNSSTPVCTSTTSCSTINNTKYYTHTWSAACTAPSITTQPSTTATSYCKGASATALSVVATGTATLSYQWQSCSTAGGTYSDISGATSSSYTPSTSATGTTYYKCYVSNSCGNVTSNASGAITVKAIATASQYTLSDNTKTYGSVSAPTITPASGAGTVSKTYYTGTSGTSYSKSTTLPTNAGTYTVTVDVNDGTTYCGATGLEIGTFTINKAQRTISITNTTTTFCQSATPTVTTQVSAGASDGTITFSIDGGTGTATIGETTGVITCTAPGTVIAKVYISGGTNYYASAPVTKTFTFDATSVAGSVAGAEVCSGSSATLTVTGYTGSIQWQKSTDGSSYSDITGATSATYTTDALTSTTYYKVKVTNGTCSAATSDPATVTVKAIAAAAQYTLSNYTKTYGNVSAPTITPATGAGTVETIYYEGTSETSYTKSSTLPTNAGTYKVYVDVNDGTTYCGATGIELSGTFTINKADQAALTFNGSTQCQTASVTLSATGGSSGQTITYTKKSGSGTVSGTTLTASAAGNVVVTATRPGGDNYNDVSAEATFTFDASSVAGTITGAAEICSGSSVTLGISGNTGTTYQWQKSTDGLSYSDISGAQSATYSTGALTATTYYKVKVANGTCAAATSDPATVTVKAQTIARTDANTFEVQIGSNDTKTLTFTQCGYSVASGDITLGGTHASEFSLGTPTISGESISVDLTFTPTSYGSKTVYVQIIDATHQFSITASALCTASEFTTVYNSAKAYNKVGGAINITSVGTCGIAEAGFKVYSDQACTNLVATNNSLDKTVGEHKGTVTINSSFNKKFYIKAYITDNNGTTTYGNVIENCTKMLPATSTGPTNVTSTSATINSKVPSQGNMTITMTKVQFKFMSGAYTTWTDASNVPQVGGTATLDVTGLTPHTSYKMCVQYIYNVTLNGVEESITAADNCKEGYLTTLYAFSAVTIDATASVCAGSTVTPTKSSTPEADSWTFTSSDETVATVDASGVVTGVKAGTATIIATAKKDGYESKSASCTVTVNAVTAISAHPSTSAVSYCVGNTATPLTVTATGTNLTYQWMSCESAEGTYTNVTTGTGGTTSSYTPSTAATSALYYKCKVSGTCGDVTSNASGLIKVNAVPTIESISANSDCGAGDITFTSTGVTTGATVNWYDGSTNVGTGSTKTYESQAAGTSKTLKATAVKDGCESAATAEATGERKAVPTLTVSLSSTAITAGETDKTYGWEVATFTPTITGGGTLTTSSVTQTTGTGGIISGNTAKGHVGDAFKGSYTATGSNSCTTTVEKTVTVIKATETCN